MLVSGLIVCAFEFIALMARFIVDLEEEPSEEFKEVTMRQHQQMRVPVVLEVGTSHLRITSVRNVGACAVLALNPIVGEGDACLTTVDLQNYRDRFVDRRQRRL